MLHLFLFVIALIFVIKSADIALTYATKLAHALRLPKYVIGFLVVAVISIMPETFIAINSSLQGSPAFGLGTLFGSNVADLTLVFVVIIFFTGSGIKVSSKILEQNKWYPFLLALPLVIGMDGYYSRIEGALLVFAGAFFYYWIFRVNHHAPLSAPHEAYHYSHILYFLLSMVVLLASSHLTVTYGIAFAQWVRIDPILVGMLVVGLGTTLPELFFSLRAVEQHRDDLAFGDILGTVISDATIVVGILALLHPFSFPQKIVYSTAAFMVIASIVLFACMRSGRVVTKKEGVFLLFFYIVFVIVEYSIG